MTPYWRRVRGLLWIPIGILIGCYVVLAIHWYRSRPQPCPCTESHLETRVVEDRVDLIPMTAGNSTTLVPVFVAGYTYQVQVCTQWGFIPGQTCRCVKETRLR